MVLLRVIERIPKFDVLITWGYSDFQSAGFTRISCSGEATIFLIHI